MIRILILSRSDLHHQAKDIPKEEVTFNHVSNEAWVAGITQYDCVLYLENGESRVLRNKGVAIQILLKEVLRELPKT